MTKKDKSFQPFRYLKGKERKEFKTLRLSVNRKKSQKQLKLLRVQEKREVQFPKTLTGKATRFFSVLGRRRKSVKLSVDERSRLRYRTLLARLRLKELKTQQQISRQNFQPPQQFAPQVSFYDQVFRAGDIVAPQVEKEISPQGVFGYNKRGELVRRSIHDEIMDAANALS